MMDKVYQISMDLQVIILDKNNKLSFSGKVLK